MKNFQNLGKTLNKVEQKSINGGIYGGCERGGCKLHSGGSCRPCSGEAGHPIR